MASREIDPDPLKTNESRRQIARREIKTAGDRSARLAHALMNVPESTLDKLELEEDLRATADRARKVTAMIARRRAERELAGQLRGADLADLTRKLANIATAGAAEPDRLKLAEQWRARLIAGGIAAAADFPGGAGDPLPRLVELARREATTKKPPGAARALFRHIVAVLKAEAAGPKGDDGGHGDSDDSDDSDS